MKRLADLAEREVLALAISNEEKDCRIYQSFADGLREQAQGPGVKAFRAHSHPGGAQPRRRGGALVFIAGILIGSS
jgi:hypothetical protein